MKTIKTVLVVAMTCIALAACTKQERQARRQRGQRYIGRDIGSDDPARSTTREGGRYTPSDLETDSCLRQRVVYFDFDQDTIKPEFQAAVACHAKYLRDRPEARMRLEGNADERGSRQYNLGLGERRGNAVMAAVQGSGGSAGQMEVISYGEERPVCTESSEDCWAKNRRVEIVYTSK